MTQQPGQDWPQENPYASGAGQPPAYPQQGIPQAPAYQQPPQYPAYPQAGYAAGGYAPAAALPPLASWGKRVGAYVIDNLLASGVLIVAGIYATVTAETIGYDISGNAVTEPTSTGNTAILLGYACLLAVQLWNRWLRQGRTGQSVGKQVVGTRLLSERTMAPVGGGMAFVRDLCHIVDSFFYLGYLWPLWDAKRQTFADKIIGTVVLDG